MIPLPPAHLLPRENATPLEISLDLGLEAAVLDIPVPIRDLWRWDTCPATHLPWLAWALSVDIWEEDWPEDKKRSVIRRSFDLHRLKGTLGGIRAYVDLAGADVYRAVKPPAKYFCGASTTPAEKERLLKSLPQVRIHLAQRRGTAGYRAFVGAGRSRFFTDSFGRKTCFPAVGDTASRFGQRAVYVYNGVSQELSWSRLSDNGERVFLRGANTRGVFCGGFVGHGHLLRTTAADRIVTLNLSRTSAADQLIHRFAVVPKLDPVNAVPFRVYERGFAPRSVFCGRPIGGKYLVPSGALQRVYDTIYLKPRDLALEARQSSTFVGVGRLGIPPFTGEITVAIKGKRPKRVTGRFVGGYLYTAPKDVLAKSLAAVRSAKAARDEILIATSTYRPLTVGTSLFIGAPLQLGSFTRS